MPPNPFHLQRFVEAQAGVYSRVLEELRRGQKQGHWMWFIFPQIQGLGASELSRFYALTSLGEAQAYVRHPVLGPRLEECTRLVLMHAAGDLEAIFGDVDSLKFHSSMTLFARAGCESLCRQALAAFFGGREDANTLAQLEI